jgi:predicted branched-subunit amino acid permease
VVDESWAIAQREPGRIDQDLLIGAGLALYASWVVARPSACSPAASSPTPSASVWT